MGRWHSPGTPSLPPRHTFPGLRRWVRAGSYLHPPSHHPFHHHPHTSSRFRSHPLLPPLPLILAHGQRGRPCPGSLAWIPPLRALSSPLFLPTWVSLGGGGGEVCDWLVYFHLSHRIRSQQLWLGGIILYFPGSSTRENSQAQRIPEGGRVRKSNKEDALSKPPLPHHTQTHTLFFFFLHLKYNYWLWVSNFVCFLCIYSRYASWPTEVSPACPHHVEGNGGEGCGWFVFGPERKEKCLAREDGDSRDGHGAQRQRKRKEITNHGFPRLRKSVGTAHTRALILSLSLPLSHTLGASGEETEAQRQEVTGTGLIAWPCGDLEKAVWGAMLPNACAASNQNGGHWSSCQTRPLLGRVHLEQGWRAVLGQ